MNNSTDQMQGLNVQTKVEVIIYLLTLILGTGGNVLVLVVIIGRQARRSVNDLFIANLAISDVAYILFFLPMKTYAKLFGDPGSSIFYCSFVYPMMTVTFSVGILTLTSMAVYRCYFIIHPFKAKLRHRTVLAWMFVIWLCSFVLALPLMIVHRLKEDDRCWEIWSIDARKSYTVALMILQCILPLIIVIAAYTRIAWDLLSSKATRACINKEGKLTTNKGEQENMQVIRTLVVIVFLFFICMFPLQITWMIDDFSDKAKVNSHALDISFIASDILCVIHACINPIVYGTLTRYYRRGYIKYLSYCLCCYRQSLLDYYFSERRSQVYEHSTKYQGCHRDETHTEITVHNSTHPRLKNTESSNNGKKNCITKVRNEVDGIGDSSV